MNTVLTSMPGRATTNSVLQNTFMLLAATFAFSALMAVAGMVLAVPAMGIWITLGVYMGILFLLHMYSNSGAGVALCFALTGWLGLTAAPLITSVLVINPMIVISAFILAVIMFVALSAYAVISGKDFSYMTGFLMTGLLVAFVAGLISAFFSLPVLGLAVSAAFVVLSSGVILWQVGEIINGGETNYILATVTLFVSFYNIFLSLLNIFGYSAD